MSSAVIGTSLPALTAHADTSVLYVNNRNSKCSDAGTGAQAQPYCTIQAAADVAQPGQTVRITGGYYQEQVVLKQSGTAQSPIVFEGELNGTRQSATRLVGGALSRNAALPHSVTAIGVHDVVLKDLSFQSLQEAVVVKDSDRITITGSVFTLVGTTSPSFATAAPAVRLSGKTTGTTISRNRFGASGGAGLAIDAGVAGTVVTTSAFNANRGGGITVTDAPGTVLTSNTVVENCGHGIALLGDSSGAAIRNNVVAQNAEGENDFGPACPDEVDLSVSAGSVPNTVVDHNLVHPNAGAVAYSWAGTRHTTRAAFTTATGQGKHDVDVDPKLNLYAQPNTDFVPTTDTAAMDSADESATGQLDVDLLGRPRVDDPLVPNTGTGTGHHDLGAFEYQKPFDVGLDLRASTAPGHPLDAIIGGTVNSPWYPAVTTLDLGDGSAPVTSPVFPLTHTYAPGTYSLKLTVTDSTGATKTADESITIQPVGSIAAGLTVYHNRPGHGPDYVEADVYPVTSPWPVRSYSIDFGDGTPAEVRSGPDGSGMIPHTYTAPGRYYVRLTVTDDHGRQGTADGWSQINFAVPGDIAIAGRWGPGRPSANGIFNGGSWALRSTGQGGLAEVTKVSFGRPGDLPAIADWDGKGHDQIGVYRNGVFLLRHLDGSATTVPFGDPGDLPVPGYWDGNGHAQLAIFRPSSRLLAVRHDNGTVTSLGFGNAGDIPLVGDWDGVGHAQLGIFRSSSATFALRHDNGTVSTAIFGNAGDQPIVGDWLNKGRATFGIYRASMATFAMSGAYAGTWGMANQLY
ncbi:PKD domain-containing protein [Kitasatospora sp. NPDC101801]|uniref:PKD domain-containing protein n=1 Tax=Kitasatospora sp. NPDC101801 TaxID=3364103 RepID=UPI003823F2D3